MKFPIKNMNVPTTNGSITKDVQIRGTFTSISLKKTKPIAIEMPSIITKPAYR
jgi:hypothetical protein